MSQKINDYLEREGITKTAFSKKIGIRKQRLNDLLLGKKTMTPDLAEKIEKASKGKIKKEHLVFPDLASCEKNESDRDPFAFNTFIKEEVSEIRKMLTDQHSKLTEHILKNGK